MGQITIEVPQKINRSYRIIDRETAAKLLSDLEKSKAAAKNKKLSAEDLEDIREAKKAKREAEKYGTIAWEDVKKELNL